MNKPNVFGFSVEYNSPNGGVRRTNGVRFIEDLQTTLEAWDKPCSARGTGRKFISRFLVIDGKLEIPFRVFYEGKLLFDSTDKVWHMLDSGGCGFLAQMSGRDDIKGRKFWFKGEVSSGVVLDFFKRGGDFSYPDKLDMRVVGQKNPTRRSGRGEEYETMAIVKGDWEKNVNGGGYVCKNRGKYVFSTENTSGFYRVTKETKKARVVKLLEEYKEWQI